MRRFIAIAALIAAVFIIPIILGFLPSDIVFNQSFIYSNLDRPTFADTFKAWRSAYSLGWQKIFGSASNSVDYNQPKEFFGYIFSRLPSYAIVYPTETYYYYTAQMADGVTLSGNLRLLDAKDGLIHIGYFDKNNPASAASENWVGTFGATDSVNIKIISDYVYDVTYNNKTVRFALIDFIHDQPKALKLLPDEEFVAQIFDESGIRFNLLFNTATKSFYYILNEDRGINESITEFSDRFYLGKRTGYVYYFDQNFNRKLLVGVSKNEIYNNSYYDGPFDQVPPRLPLKEKLEAAYPYVVYRGGIDEHGNFNEIEGSRVAISPYYDYETVFDLLSYLSRCDESQGKSVFWSCLTYEWKKDFHKTLEGRTAELGHAIFTSQGWPANHSAEVSLSWPQNHTAAVSRTWPPDHLPAVSK